MARDRYKWRRIRGRIGNFVWSLVTLTITAILIAVCVYGCAKYARVMDRDGLPGAPRL